MKKLISSFFCAVSLLTLSNIASAEGSEAALTTSLAGSVKREEAMLRSFEKLKVGDKLQLSPNARIVLVYFDNGRQETWEGAGKLRINKSESRGEGNFTPQVKTLPMLLVKQLARTPSLDSQGRAGVMRLRSIPTSAAVNQIEADYKRMRTEANKDDLNPELYLLSALLEKREAGRIEQVLTELLQQQPNNEEIKAIATLYRNALKGAREKAEP